MFDNLESHSIIVVTITIGIVVVILGILMRHGLTEAYLHLKRDGLKLLLKRPAAQSRKEYDRRRFPGDSGVDMNRSKLTWFSIINLVKGTAVYMKKSKVSSGSKIIIHETEPQDNNSRRSKSGELHSR